MSAQNKVNSTVLDQAAEWTTIVDSGEMSEEQRLDFNTWVDEPHNARELGAMRTLVSLIQELPERKAVTLHRMPLALALFLTQLLVSLLPRKTVINSVSTTLREPNFLFLG